MPPLPAVANAVRVNFTTNSDADIPAGSRFFLAYTGSPPNSTDLNTLATDVSAAWGTNIAPYVNSGEHLVEVEIEDLSSDTAAVGLWTGSIAGSNSSGASLPASAAVVMAHHIGRKYRGGHPRTYLRAGMTGDFSSKTNEWSSSFMTNILGAWEAWIAEILATTGLSITLTNIINVSYFSGFTSVPNPVTGKTKFPPKLRVGGPVTDVIRSTTVATKIGSQRRRLNL